MRNAAALRLAAFVLLAGALLPARAQDTATAQQVGGTVSVQRADGVPRLLAQGATLQPGDLVVTQADSFARLRFADGAELSLRGGSALRIDAFIFRKAEPASDNFALTLLRGGLRTVTGLVSRRGNPDAFRLNAATATIGVRGTDFTARICQGSECADDEPRGVPRRAVAPIIVARAAQVEGAVSAVSQDGRARALATGGPVYANEMIDSAAGSQAVLVFLDQSRVTVQAGTRMIVERYRFEPGRPGTGEVLLNLLRGGLRALTGTIARERPESFLVRTTVATIGVRGTGFDVSCLGACALDTPFGTRPPTDAQPAGSDAPAGLHATPWLGRIVVGNPGGEVVLDLGEVAFVAAPGQGPERVPLPDFLRANPAIRPDTVEVDPKALFNATLPPDSGPGLYLTVNDGEVVSSGDGFRQVLVRGETFFLSPDGRRFGSLAAPPAFILRDPFVARPGWSTQSCTVR